MSLMDHLDELRRRILYSVAGIALGFVVGFYFSQEAFEFLARPMLEALRDAGLADRLIYTSPLGPLRMLITVGLYLGVLLALPLVLYQLWLFVAPGLYRNERHAVVSFLVSGVFLFASGTAFGYVVMLPVTLRFLISFEGPYTAMISINDYFDMVLVILLGLGLVFQLPILIFFLSLFGIVTPRFLWDNFRYAVLAIAILAALVTPTTDVLTMSIFMAPMLVLYLLGVGVSWLVVRRKRQREKEVAGAGAAQLAWIVSVGALLSLAALSGCSKETSQGASTPAPQRVQSAAAEAPAPETTGGFDGGKAFAHVERLVGIGPRVPATEGIRKAQDYIRSTLEGFGCKVEEDAFSASTPRGRVAMKNIVAKIPGKKTDRLLLLTHYDTFQLPGFVGANDSGSSTGLMLEMARLLCKRENSLSIWIAFLDGEEAFVEWSDTDGTYGSRQLAAQMALAGELKQTRAVILADMIGDRNLNLKRESNSTPWLVDLVWGVAHRLGYKEHFLDSSEAIQDDHIPFLRRGVPAIDLIDYDYPPWHTAEDTLDKISPRSLAIVGHVILESIAELEKKFR
jgi:Tat protein translocase TatC